MLLVLILLLLGILVFLYLIGVFADIQIKTDVPHPLKNKYVAYRFYKNEYKSAGKGVDDIKKIIKNDSFIFGIYYDDPEIVCYRLNLFRSLNKITQNIKLRLDFELFYS